MPVTVSRVGDPLKIHQNSMESLQTVIILLSQWEQQWVH